MSLLTIELILKPRGNESHQMTRMRAHWWMYRYVKYLILNFNTRWRSHRNQLTLSLYKTLYRRYNQRVQSNFLWWENFRVIKTHSKCLNLVVLLRIMIIKYLKSFFKPKHQSKPTKSRSDQIFDDEKVPFGCTLRLNLWFLGTVLLKTRCAKQ